MIDEKTITLTVAEFRKNVKAALDFAVQGGVVIIDRMGQRFMLSNIGRDSDIIIGSSKGVVLQSTPPEKKSPGATPQLLTPAEHPCCEKQKPCKHWQYDDVRQVWVNSVSGRERGVE